MPEAGAASAESDARIVAAEAGSAERDFDAVSWAWMVALGALLPAALILAGWMLGPGAAR